MSSLTRIHRRKCLDSTCRSGCRRRSGGLPDSSVNADGRLSGMDRDRGSRPRARKSRKRAASAFSFKSGKLLAVDSVNQAIDHATARKIRGSVSIPSPHENCGHRSRSAADRTRQMRAGVEVDMNITVIDQNGESHSLAGDQFASWPEVRL